MKIIKTRKISQMSRARFNPSPVCKQTHKVLFQRLFEKKNLTKRFSVTVLWHDLNVCLWKVKAICQHGVHNVESYSVYNHYLSLVFCCLVKLWLSLSAVYLYNIWHVTLKYKKSRWQRQTCTVYDRTRIFLSPKWTLNLSSCHYISELTFITFLYL